MNPACQACKGACCSTIVFPLPSDEVAVEWITARGKREGNTVRLACACPQLTRDGRCGIHDTKPHICAIYQVGSPECIAAIRAQRPRNAPYLVRLAQRNQG